MEQLRRVLTNGRFVRTWNNLERMACLLTFKESDLHPKRLKLDVGIVDQWGQSNGHGQSTVDVCRVKFQA